MEDGLGHLIDVRRTGRWATVTVVALVLAWPAGAAPSAQPAPTSEQLYQVLQSVTVRIDVEMPDQRGICTGWTGWSEPSRSAVYTAAHCYHPTGRYRIKVAGGVVYADGFAKWDGLDFMALWIPRGALPVLRSWKHLPGAPFRALYMLSEHGNGMRPVEVDIPRVYWELRFQNRPAAVAVPLYSHPGTSGAPIIDMADGLLVGMVVGFLDDRPDIAAVVPAQAIYEALATATK